jgi:hypothetical protein
MKKPLERNRIRRLVAPVATRIRQSPALLSLTRRGKSRLLGTQEVWQVTAETVDPRYRVDFRAMLPTRYRANIGFIASKQDPTVPYFQRALEMLGIGGQVYDPARDDFHDRILAGPERIFLSRPMHFTNQDRQLFWEKTLPLYDWSEASVSPSRRALNIYESKRELAYFLKMNGIPHPETHIFYDMEEALAFAKDCPLPQVFKTNTGSSATGVEILRERKALIALVRDVFCRHYVKRSLSDYRDIDYGHVILQKFITPVREFRVIRVGESWFGHEKLPGAESELMSGSGINAWTPPPRDLLNFCAGLSDQLGFSMMCFDIFRSGDGPWLVNEMQTWFGSYDNSQMYIDGVPGRYTRKDGKWVFEPGFFNECCSLPLIIANAISSG